MIILACCSLMTRICSSTFTSEQTTDLSPATLQALSSMRLGSQATTAGNIMCSVSSLFNPAERRAAAMESTMFSRSSFV